MKPARWVDLLWASLQTVSLRLVVVLLATIPIPVGLFWLWPSTASKSVSNRVGGPPPELAVSSHPLSLMTPSPTPTAPSTVLDPTPPIGTALVKPAATICPGSNLLQLTGLGRRSAELASWLHQPLPVTLSEFWGPVVAANFTPRPFPEIHPRARLSKVPVLMYHDILPEKQVFFDVTPAEFEVHLKLIQEQGLTPISLEQLVNHLQTGAPLPAKPVVLSFDDGYEGHYLYVYPLLKKYGFPGTFAIYPSKVGKRIGRSSLTWEQLRQMAADPLITITSHSLTHPPDLTALPDDQIRREVVESKQVLETQLGIPIRDFVYPEGKYNARVQYWVQQAGYRSAQTMNDLDERFAGQSESLLAIGRIGQSRTREVTAQADGGPPLPNWSSRFDFAAPVAVNRVTINNTPLILIAGGKPITIHAKRRYQVQEIIANTEAVAAVDGGFFSLKYLDSNVMIGPVLSRNTGQFLPGNISENPRLQGRPLVLLNDRAVLFVPFDHRRHQTLGGIQAELPGVTDAFVAAAWLVRQNQPQPPAAFGNLFDFNAARHRAFWGINQAGQPVIGVSSEPVGSVDLGEILAQAGFREAVMLDSGASTSLAFRGESLVGYIPRPVPHAVALVPTGGVVATDSKSCPLAKPAQSPAQP